MVNGGSDPDKSGVPKKSPPEGGTEPSFDELVDQLESELKKVPSDKLAAAREQVKDMLQGETKWADLLNWTPEKLHQTAKEGYSQYDMGQYHSAELIFKGLTVLDPDNFYYHQMLGACYQQQKKFPEAIIEYSIAVNLKADDVTSLTNRGEVYFQLKLWDLADQDFAAAIALDPQEQDRWANRARLLRKKLTGIRKAQKAPDKTVKG